MSYLVEQKIGNYVYVYKAVSYWDKEKKQSRQKRKLIGKRDPETGDIIPTGSSNKLKLIKEFGPVYFFNEIAEKIALNEILKKIFPDYKKIVLLSFFYILEGKPSYLASKWVENIYTPINSRDISSQRISELLEKIGENPDKKFNFFKNWIKKNKNDKTIFYDITSLSTYSKKLDLAEWGYNRDKENIPQINIGITYGKENGLPLNYYFYQGSIPDVKTLKKTVDLNKSLGLKNVTYVMDRGFYSKNNLEKISDKNVIIPLPYSTSLSKKILEKYEDKLSSTDNMIVHKDNLYYYAKTKDNIGKNDYDFHIFRDKVKFHNQEEIFYKDLIRIEKHMNKLNFKNEEKLLEELNLLAKNKSKFYKINKTDNGYIIERNHKEIKAAIQRFGTIIILTTREDEDKEKIIDAQKEKDAIEKVFNMMKNEINKDRIRVNSRKRVDGKLLIIFISLILISYMNKIKNKSDKLNGLSKQQLIYELKKIKVIKYKNDLEVVTQISKTAREIFECFNIEIPKINT